MHGNKPLMLLGALATIRRAREANRDGELCVCELVLVVRGRPKAS